jgi:hypothetical protein
MKGRILELEFEAPVADFVLSASRVTVCVGGQPVTVASVIPGRSTRGGPVAKGLLVKLGLELKHGKSWDDWREVEVSWWEDGEPADGSRRLTQVTLRVSLTPRAGKGRR